MATLDQITKYNLRNTQEDLLIMRILDEMATNTDLANLIKGHPNFGFTYGEPPKGKVNTSPGMCVWISRDRPQVNAQGSVFFTEFLVSMKVTILNTTPPRPIARDNNGIRKERFYDITIPLREAYAIKKAIRTVLETKGYDNKWSYTWVSDGCMGGPNMIQFDYDSFGGNVTGGQAVQEMTVQFRVKTEIESSAEIFDGDISITVSNGSPVVGASVWIKDTTGHYVEDSSGDHVWTTDGTGVATATGLIAQKGCTVYAESGSESGSTASQVIPNNDTLTATVTIS